SGDVSEQEWSKPQPARPDLRSQLIENFESVDTDKSGDLSKEEMTEARQASADEATKAAESGAQPNPPVVYYRYDSTM
ncbi:hypothetical protein AB9K41_20385, partial [Cribrihabitans sp. XS_ASV171]